MLKIKKIIPLFLSGFKSLYVNFRFLPFHEAIHFPLYVHYKAHVRVSRGSFVFETPIRRGLVHLGFQKLPIIDENAETSIEVSPKGKIIIGGTAFMGRGSKLIVPGGRLSLGNHFFMTGFSSVVCSHRIEFGRNTLCSWECLIKDGDGHPVFDAIGNHCNSDKPIIVGDNVWIGCRCTIWKGTVIPSDCVIGTGSLLAGGKFSPHTVIAGHPAKSVKEIKGWAHKL